MLSVTKSPTAAKNVVRSGLNTRSWTYVTNVFESESEIREASLSGRMRDAYPHTDYLMCSGFGFEIPNEFMITGITCHINVEGTSADAVGFSVVSLTTNYNDLAGNNLSDGSILPTIYTIKNFGGETELWGVPLTPNIVNSTNFGVVFAFERVSGSPYVHVDHIQITVHYEEESGLGMFTKVSGVVKEIEKGYIKVGGIWKPVEKSLKKVGTSWKE